MKRILLLAGGLYICLSVCTVRAQVNDPNQVAQDAAATHANNDMDIAADKGLNKAGQGIGNLFKKKKEKGSAKSGTPASGPAVPEGNQKNPNASLSQEPPIKTYQNYDFVAGDKIIFEDDFISDQDGEFPAHWELKKGQGAVNKQQGFQTFTLTDGNYVVVNPRVSTESYLGNEFTVEWDVYSEAGSYGTHLFFHLPAVTEDQDADLSINKDEVSYNSQDANIDMNGSLPSDIAGDNHINKWHHIAVGYKNKQIKVYVDQYRVLVVPDCKMVFGSLSFGGSASQDAPILFKDVKMASGGSQNMIGNILTNGKFVTHGITFDIDKAVLRPESMGVLNELAKFLKENGSVNMEIDGHTDNSGAAAHNLTLSQQRADAVKAQLLSMGIDGARLSTKGFGDTRPNADNGSPEGRANNRRVEFVKK
ncbi:MAG TPA: OmpA family protein [Puia sp.]